MNKLLSLLYGIISLCVVSCLEPDTLVSSQNSETNYKVSAKEAEETVANFLSSLEQSDDSLSRNYTTPKRRIQNVKALCSSSVMSRSVDMHGMDTLIYIVNFQDNNGFAIVGADKRTEPIFALIDRGNYSVDSLEHETNDAFITFLDNAITTELNDIRAFSPSSASQPTKKGWIILAKCDPILQTRWDQGYPDSPLSFGKYCPNLITGCTVTAVAQILSHFQTVTRVPKANSRTNESITLNWPRIIDDCIKHNGALAPYHTPESMDEVAHLCRYLGNAFGAKYKAGKPHPETAVADDKPIAWLNSHASNGLSATKLAKYNEFRILSALSSYRKRSLVYGRGNSGQKKFLFINIGYTGGHAWVYDGYISATKDHKSYSLLFHCNWGWSGSRNGYYLSKVFDTNNGAEISDVEAESRGGSKNYKYNLEYSIITKR